MSDFHLDFRSLEVRRSAARQATDLLSFCSDTKVRVVEHSCFSLVLARVDGFELWGPCEHKSEEGSILVALAGRVALEESEWAAANKLDGGGGLACRAILDKYRQHGLAGLTSLNGNFVAFVSDDRCRQFHIVTDRGGMLMAYRHEEVERFPAFGSHPDVLASVLGEAQNWDMGSMAEFLMTSRVSFPHTYYRRIRAVAPASTTSVDLRQGSAVIQPERSYFSFKFNIDLSATEADLAQELADAFKSAVRKRSLPIFGRTGIALSGGLDSRTILSAVDPRADVKAFCLHDQDNLEFQTARMIAQACKVELVPMKRDFEYYGTSAALGVRVSGGSGCITCNHFLGVRENLQSLGITNLLTGCYCDYLFKGLALNRREDWLTRNDRLAPFRFEYYDPLHSLLTGFREEVMARLKATFPEAMQSRLSDQDWLEVERKRTFPLAYEQDLAQRLIPQRLMSWFVPAADNGLMDIFLRIPIHFKLNASVFKKMLPLVCAKSVCAIPDSNTGAPIDASGIEYAFHRCWSALRNRIKKRITADIATAGSWPDWQYYLQHSQVLERLWSTPSPAARGAFVAILGSDPLAKRVRDFAALDQVVLFQRLLTLKLWIEQRTA